MSQYDDPEWMKCFRKVITEQLELYKKGETTGTSYELAQRYFPDNLDRQTDMCMWIGEGLGRAHELGYKEGEVPTNLAKQLAEKYNMTKIMDLEIALLRSNGETAILDKET